jgi:hypothetical protein
MRNIYINTLVSKLQITRQSVRSRSRWAYRIKTDLREVKQMKDLRHGHAWQGINSEKLLSSEMWHREVWWINTCISEESTNHNDARENLRSCKAGQSQNLDSCCSCIKTGRDLNCGALYTTSSPRLFDFITNCSKRKLISALHLSQYFPPVVSFFFYIQK